MYLGVAAFLFASWLSRVISAQEMIVRQGSAEEPKPARSLLGKWRKHWGRDRRESPVTQPLSDQAKAHRASVQTHEESTAILSSYSLELIPSSLDLPALKRLVVERHPSLAQSMYLIQAARGLEMQAGLYPNPIMGYSGSEIGDEGRGGQQGFVIGQELPRGDKLRLSRMQACIEREQAEAQAAIKSTRLMNRLESLFYANLAAKRTLDLTQELARLAQEGVAIAEQREKAGEGTLGEVLQAQIELEQTRILVSNSESVRRATWKQLAALAGITDSESIPLDGDLEITGHEQDERTQLAVILDQSPEVRLAELGVCRAETVLARARVEPIPNVTLEGGSQYDFATNTPIASLGVSFPIPVHDKNQGNILAAQAQLGSARREVDRVRISLADRFAASYARYRTAVAQVDRYGSRLTEESVKRILSLRGQERQQALNDHPQILPRAQFALGLATEGWQRGEYSYLQVLTAQRTLTQVSLEYIRALSDLRQSLVALDNNLLIDE